MKKRIGKVFVLIVIFVLSLFVISRIINKGKHDLIAPMDDASLPVVYMKYNGAEVNELHGFTGEIDTGYLRDGIVPISAEGKLFFVINAYDNEIDSISYEIRSCDSSKLIQNGRLENWSRQNDRIEAEIDVQNLLEEEEEYLFIMNIDTAHSDEIKYVTRAVYLEECYLTEQMEFAMDFHDRIFDKTEAKEIVKYLETKSGTDNTSLAHVTINSSFENITWGNLAVNRPENVKVTITELNEATASIVMEYEMEILEEETSRTYNIKEFFRVRYTNTRMYLLNYERWMDQLFMPVEESFLGQSIQLGITQENQAAAVASDDGKITCFVKERELWCYNDNSNMLTEIFSFRKEKTDGVRERYNQHDIKIVHVENDGTVDFLVYGYMNRGIHEGQVGVILYRYNSNENSIEERVFLPSSKPYQLLEKDLGQLSYVSGSDNLYLLINEKVYKIDLNERSYEIVIENLQADQYVVSDDNDMIGWMAEGNEEINILNLDTEVVNRILPESETSIRPVGFVSGDFVYGVVRNSDIVTEESGEEIYPMYRLLIINNRKEVVKTYEQEGIYIMDADVENGVLNLVRAVWQDDGYVETTGDFIVNNETEAQSEISLEYKKDDTRKKELYLNLVSKNDGGQLVRQIETKEVLYEDRRTIELENEEAEDGKYYVYGLGKLQSIEESAAGAVIKADGLMGVVVDADQNKIWERKVRPMRQLISDLPQISSDETSDSFTACILALHRYYWGSSQALSMLNEGKGYLEALENEGAGKALNLTGLSQDEVLYYVSRKIPVIAKREDGSYQIIVGYDELNVSFYNPFTAETLKKGLNDSSSDLEGAGNVYYALLVK